MNTELLINLYRVYSPSGNEKKMRKFIKDYLRRNGVTNVRVNKGNIYVTKGEAETYPCICSHMDQVQKSHAKDFSVAEVGGDLLGYSPSNHTRQGLGADDKNGIFVALECLVKYDVMKAVFFWGEEIGCQGSSQADMEFFKDCRFCVQCDRRNGGDLIYDVSGQMASDEFLDDCGYKDFGYHLEHGLSTDVATLADDGVGISCINLSCGYYNPHTDYEITNLAELQNCLDFVCHIIENCTKRYDHKMIYPSYGGSSLWGRLRHHIKDEDYDHDFVFITELIKENYPEINAGAIYDNYKDMLKVKSYFDFCDIFDDAWYSFYYLNDDALEDDCLSGIPDAV